MARRLSSTRKSGDADWLRSAAVVIVGALFINQIIQRYAPGVTRRAGKVVPSVVPEGLPAFPAGWEPFLPLKPAISKRAAELIFQLWRQGEGATLTEQTGGDWVTYQAQVHQEGDKRKHGVGAYRLKAVVRGAVA